MTQTWICILASAAALLAADKPAPKPSATAARSAAPAKPAQAKPAQSLTLPAGAVQVSPETWRYTDAGGQKWMYRKTPFGLVRYEDKEGPAAAAGVGEKELAGIKVTEDGDTVHFERPGPFGPQKWTRKQSELNEVEQQALERSRKTAASSARK